MGGECFFRFWQWNRMVFYGLSPVLLNNNQYRLNSERANYIRNGGKLGRKQGRIKTEGQKREEYKKVLTLLKKGYPIRNTAKLTGVSISTVQRVKKELLLGD